MGCTLEILFYYFFKLQITILKFGLFVTYYKALEFEFYSLKLEDVWILNAFRNLDFTFNF